MDFLFVFLFLSFFFKVLPLIELSNNSIFQPFGIQWLGIHDTRINGGKCSLSAWTPFIHHHLTAMLLQPGYHSRSRATMTLASLSNNVFERRTSTGSGLFSFFDGGFAQIFSQIASITVKKLRNTNFISPRHVKRENTSLPVDVRRSKTWLLKLPIREL